MATKIKQKIIIALLSVFFILIISQQKLLASNFQYAITGSEKIKITEASFVRLIEFTKGRFYSKVYGAKIYQVIGLYFALSENGNTVAFSFCEDDIIGCNENLLKYQTKATCEKFAKQACNIIAINKNLVLNKKLIPIDEKTVREYFIINMDKSVPSISYEIRAQNLRDSGNDNYE